MCVCVCACVRACVRACVCVCVSDPRLIQLALASYYAVNIIKVYIERCNMQVALIRFRKKYRLYPHLRLRLEEMHSSKFRT